MVLWVMNMLIRNSSFSSIFMVLAMLLASCSDPEIIAVKSLDAEFYSQQRLTLSLGSDEGTRIELMGGKCVWSKGDYVSVYNFSNANQKWQFEGNTGERRGSFKLIEAPKSSRQTSTIVALYPYDTNYWINSTTCNVETKLPATQHYAEDSFGRGSSIMVARGDEPDMMLRNICGWLRLHLAGDGQRVERVSLRGNNNEQLAGRIYIYTEDATLQLASTPDIGGDGDVGGSLIFDGDIIEEVVLECDGCELQDKPKAFYIALPPITFSEGFTVTVECSDGGVMTKQTSNEVVIERNHIKPMAAIKFHGDK